MLDKAKAVEVVGVVELQGLKCHEIRIDAEELIWYLYFNIDTFLLEFWTNSPDGVKSTLTKVFDYQRFGDFLIPMSVIKTRNGAIFFSSRRSRIELNVDIDPEGFVYKRK